MGKPSKRARGKQARRQDAITAFMPIKGLKCPWEEMKGAYGQITQLGIKSFYLFQLKSELKI